MPKTDLSLKEKVRTLRKEGHSITEIVERTGANKATVSNWVRDLPLTAEQRIALTKDNYRWANAYEGGQANRRKGLIARKTAQREGQERAQQGDALHEMGCILYWAEGAKRKSGIHLINTDPDMLIFFMRFLRESLNVPDEWVSLNIYCNTEDIQEHERIKRYWLQTLQLPLSSFRKVLIKLESKHQHSEQDNGICTIQVHRTHLVMHIFGAIQEYTEIDNPAWLF